MSLVPSKKITWLAPDSASTSRSRRSSAGGPLPPDTTRLPAMPALATALRWSSGSAARRVARMSVQRWYWSGTTTPPPSSPPLVVVLQRPSVIESPSVTIVLRVLDITSTAPTQYTGNARMAVPCATGFTGLKPLAPTAAAWLPRAM